MPSSLQKQDQRLQFSLGRAVKAKISAAYLAADSPVNGDSFDTQGLARVTLLLTPGTVTDGTHTPKVQESADATTWTDVAAADQLGTLAALATDTNQSVDYIGSKRYVRCVVTITGTTVGGAYSAVWLGKKMRI